MNGFFWLASYPKSGNTWLRLYLESLLQADGGTPDINLLSASGGHAALRPKFDRILDISSSDLTDEEIAIARPQQYQIEAAQANTPLLRKVHDAWGLNPAGKALFPPEVTLGALHIVRDPRDVAVSLAHHMNRTIDHAILRMASPTDQMELGKKRIPHQLPQHLDTWSGHTESWMSAPINRLLVKYEDMQADPVAKFSQITHFLRIDAPADKITSAVESVQFERLQKLEKQQGFAEAPWDMQGFFRRGIVGGWQDSLSAEQRKQIETDHGATMRKLAYL